MQHKHSMTKSQRYLTNNTSYPKKKSLNIRINSISPGGIYRKQPKKFIKKYLEKTPLKRMCKEEDVANAVVFFSSDLSNYITGQNLIIDGGYSSL